MTTAILNPRSRAILLAASGLVLSVSVMAQTFTTLHSFTASLQFTNNDGGHPFAGLLLADKILYGTSSSGGGSGNGTVFAVRRDGTGFATLHSFAGVSDGASPRAGLILAGNTLYGTTTLGGNSNSGTVFAVRTDGMDFTALHSFTGLSDEASPMGGLVLSGDTLFGTTVGGGRSGSGTVFAVNTNGAAFTTLHAFTATSASSPFSNNDGAWPFAGLTLAGHTLYGTTTAGGVAGNGTVFAVSTDGTGFRNLYTFTAASGNTNRDGAVPRASLVLSGDILYGTTVYGGLFGRGTLFALRTDGSGFTSLHHFSGQSDGADPQTALVLFGNMLYGIANAGGTSGFGTVFVLGTNGTGFTTLYNFPRPDGEPHQFYSDLSLAAGSVYGTTFMHGSAGNGTVFSLSFPPQLTITPSDATTIVSWPTYYSGFDYTGFTLESTTNLVSPSWVTNSAAPMVVGGWNTVTNPISRDPQFFRLRQ